MTGTSPDREVVQRRLLHLLETVEVLRTFQGTPLTELASNPTTSWAIQHGLQISVQAVLDVAAHCVAAAGAPVPDQYRAAILALGPLGVLPEEFAERIAPMAGFRNVLVHHYVEVDLRAVKALLDEHLDDFLDFARHVTRYLDA